MTDEICDHQVEKEYHDKMVRQRQRGNLLFRWLKCSGCNAVFLFCTPLVKDVGHPEGS